MVHTSLGPHAVQWAGCSQVAPLPPSLALLCQHWPTFVVFRRKSSDPLPDPSAATKADTFCTKLIATSPEHSASQSQDVTGADERKVSEDAPESSSTKKPVVIVQPDLEVAPHQPPTSTTLSVLPVYVDDEGVIYAHDMDEGEGQCV